MVEFHFDDSLFDLVNDENSTSNLMVRRDNFYKALYANRTDEVKSFVEQGVSLEDQDGGNYPLLIAASHSNNELIEFFIEKGVEIDCRNDIRHTPLMEAVFKNNEKGALLLLDAGASAFAQSDLKVSACMKAIQTGQMDLVKEFVTRSSFPSINQTDKSGTTLLMFAAMSHDLDTLNLILSYNPELNEKNADGKTALDYAKEFCWEEGVKSIDSHVQKLAPAVPDKEEVVVEEQVPEKTETPRLVSKISRRRP